MTIFRVANVSAIFGVVGLGAALALSCSAAGGADAENVSATSSDLYLNGATWGGVVPVCFDGATGNNPTLIAQIRTLVNDSWGKAAQISFTGWGQCNYASSNPQQSILAITFKNDSIGTTNNRGPVPHTCSGTVCTPGVTKIELLDDDASPFQQHFRYEVIHEFGHALGFAHEQVRPDNFTAGGAPIFCSIGTDGRLTGGVFETPNVDNDSIMSYCSLEPLIGTPPAVSPTPIHNLRTLLSPGDIGGARRVYGRNVNAHGFLIQSSGQPSLSVIAAGATEGTPLKLSSGCTTANPDCTWSYQYGMLVSDTDPTLAINAWGGAAQGTALKLTRSCNMNNPDCTWTFKNGEFLSDTNPALAIKPLNSLVSGAPLQLTTGCNPMSSSCTWVLPHLMFSSARNSTLGVNAWQGAANGVIIRLHTACDAINPDCTWQFNRGLLISDRNTSLYMTAAGPAVNGTLVQLATGCTVNTPSCTWTWHRGELISDLSGATPFGMLAVGGVGSGGAVFGAELALESSVSPTNADGVFSSFFAAN